jgi:hypothetical protein
MKQTIHWINVKQSIINRFKSLKANELPDTFCNRAIPAKNLN